MNSSWKRQVSSLLFLAAATAAFFGFPNAAEAAGCPTTPVEEHGGTHWCYSHSGHGNVHIWKPPGYAADTAVTIVYIHGLDTGKNGPDTCNKKRPYVDCIWDASDHDIVGQFAASGVNALFVAVSGQTDPGDGRTWGSLGALITSIEQRGKIAVPKDVTVLGHSAGMQTTLNLLGDARLKHVTSVDWVASGIDTALINWYNKGEGRKLTLLGGSGGQQKLMNAMVQTITCPLAKDPKNLTGEELALRCVYMKPSLGGNGHMRVVMDKVYMPQAMKRSSGVAASGGAGAEAGTAGGAGTTTRPLLDGAIDAPLLEIPIPGLELTKAVREDGGITIPWLAQYAGGVYTFLLSIVGMVAAVMMVVGGFQYLTSGGDKTRIGKGRKRMVDALSGLVLALSSYVILYSINPNLVSFDGLKIAGVSTELGGIETADIDGELTAPTMAGPVDIGPQPANCPAGSQPKSPCANNRDGCRAICMLAGCTSTCEEEIKWFIDNNKKLTGLRAENCATTCPNKSAWTQKYEPICGMAHPSSTTNLSQALSGVAGIKVPNKNETATKGVVEGLRIVAAKAVSQGYVLQINDAYRPFVDQMSKACNKILGADAIIKVANSGTYDASISSTLKQRADISYSELGPKLAWPGGSPHGSGIAVDLALLKNGKVVSGTSFGKEENFILDRLMTEGTGWVKYGVECWHYDWGAKVGPNSRCLWPDCPWPTKYCKVP